CHSQSLGQFGDTIAILLGSTMRPLLACLVLVSLLTACGYKGPLFLPKASTSPTAATSSQP
ncbi:MAG: lipoprotein, partial [Aquaspirillum sp.]|nr:lipoprotein [Aquaspirillum sp.]